MAIDKILGNGNLDRVADSVFSAVNDSVSEIKAMQKRKAAENVQIVIQALKKIESDLQDKYDGVTTVIEKRVASIKNGQDGRNGVDGKAGKDGRPGRDGATGPRGADGLNGRNGVDGEDGVSVTDARIDFDGSLVIGLSSGREINVGEVVAPDLAERIKVITNGGGTSQGVLDTLTSLQNQINVLTGLGAVNYVGTWNASTNTPTLVAGTGDKGDYYVVSVAGGTSIDGQALWGVGDWIIFNGTAWQKVDGGSTGDFTTISASGAVTLSGGTANGVTYLNGSKVLTSGSALTFNGTNLGVTGTLSTTSFGVLGARTQIKGTNADITGATGSGTEIFGGSAPGILAYNRDASAYLPLTVNAQTVSLQAEGTTRGLFSSTGVAVAGSATAHSFIPSFSTVPTNGMYLPSANNVGFSINSSEQMRLTSTGLGIGTSSPAEKLTVAGSVSSSSEFVIKSGTTAKFALGQTSDAFYIYSNAAGTERMRLDSSGNLGLGVTPSAWNATNIKALQISNGGFANNGGSGFITNNAFYTGSYVPTYIATNPAQMISFNRAGGNDIQFLVAPSGTAGAAITFTQAMTLDASGNLLVGTTSTSGGKVQTVSAAAGTQCYLAWNTAASGTRYFHYFGVGSGGSPTGVGSITSDGTTTTYATSSDYRLKNITGPITTSGAYIDSLNPVEGTWKADDSTFVGLIAHEVQEASRTTVATGVKDGEQMQGMDYSSSEMIANMIAELKALRARVAALEAAA